MVSVVSLAASSSRGRMISSSSCILATSSEVRSSWGYGGHREENRYDRGLERKPGLEGAGDRALQGCPHSVAPGCPVDPRKEQSPESLRRNLLWPCLWAGSVPSFDEGGSHPWSRAKVEQAESCSCPGPTAPPQLTLSRPLFMRFLPVLSSCFFCPMRMEKILSSSR